MSNVTSEVGDMIRDGMSMEASRGITEEQSNSSSNLVSVIKSRHPPILPKSANHIVIYQIVTLLLT